MIHYNLSCVVVVDVCPQLWAFIIIKVEIAMVIGCGTRSRLSGFHGDGDRR